ncbi:hypothetical protein BT69DRAFT_1337011 [Atractiella rhizophila]|nr:hypothetical protein BT69DRAFT_1337011 [Atractiella rhizophila]
MSGVELEKKKKRQNDDVPGGDKDDSGIYWTWHGEEGKGEDMAWGALEKELNNRNKYTISNRRTASMDFGLPTRGKKPELVQRILQHQPNVRRNEGGRE